MIGFSAQCYQLVSKIPKGKISTYKEIGLTLNTKAYRSIGRIMAKNPHLIDVPCHRVVKTDGYIGGYALGMMKKIELLQDEGLIIKNNRIVNYKNYMFYFIAKH